MQSAHEPIGTDFGAGPRHAALDDWRRRARAAEARGMLGRHPIATSVLVGAACGLALALWRSNLSPAGTRRFAARNAPRGP